MATISQKINIFYKSRWDFKDQKTGEQKRGCTIKYIFLDGMLSSDNKVGYEIEQSTIDYNDYNKINVNTPVVGEFAIYGTKLKLLNILPI